MSIHRRTTLLVCAIAAVTALTLAPLPVAANTVDAEITAGTWTLKTPAGSTIVAIDLSSGVDCGTDPSTLTATSGPPNATVQTTVRWKKAINGLFGGHWIITTTWSGNATHSGSTSLSGGMSATFSIVKSSTTSAACTPLPGAGICTTTASNINYTGTMTAATFPTLVATDTATVSGGNTAFNTIVTGSAANCGGWTTVNNGSMTLSALSLHVI